MVSVNLVMCAVVRLSRLDLNNRLATNYSIIPCLEAQGNTVVLQPCYIAILLNRYIWKHFFLFYFFFNLEVNVRHIITQYYKICRSFLF